MKKSNQVISPKKSRILYIEMAEDHTVGGSHQALYDLVRRLDQTRYIPVILFYQDNIFADRLRQSGFEVYTYEDQRMRERFVFNSGGKPRKIMEIFAMVGRRSFFIRNHQIGLVHLNNSPSAGCYDWLPAAKLNHIPCVATCMGILKPIQNPVYRFMLRSFDRVIPVSDYVANVAIDVGIPRSRISIVNHGIDLEGIRCSIQRSPKEVRLELGIPPERVLVGMVGNIRRWKGQHVLLAALCQLAPELLMNVYVIFAGDAGPDYAAYEEELIKTVREEKLENHVAFLGYREDVPDLLSAADIIVHASIEPEPGGIIVLEAMALGKAVVAADVGGHTEVLTEECGLHFDTKDPGKLADALSSLITDRTRRVALGKAASQRIKKFSLDRNVRKTQFVYERVLKARS